MTVSLVPRPSPPPVLSLQYEKTEGESLVLIMWFATVQMNHRFQIQMQRYICIIHPLFVQWGMGCLFSLVPRPRPKLGRRPGHTCKNPHMCCVSSVRVTRPLSRFSGGAWGQRQCLSASKVGHTKINVSHDDCCSYQEDRCHFWLCTWKPASQYDKF